MRNDVPQQHTLWVMTRILQNNNPALDFKGFPKLAIMQVRMIDRGILVKTYFMPRDLGKMKSDVLKYRSLIARMEPGLNEMRRDRGLLYAVEIDGHWYTRDNFLAIKKKIHDDVLCCKKGRDSSMKIRPYFFCSWILESRMTMT